MASTYMLDSPHVQPLSRSSLVFPLVLNPQLHTPYISSPSHRHLFAWIVLKWRKFIKDVRWSGWVRVGECFFWYQPIRVVPAKGRLTVVCVRTTWIRSVQVIHQQHRRNAAMPADITRTTPTAIPNAIYQLHDFGACNTHKPELHSLTGHSSKIPAYNL